MKRALSIYIFLLTVVASMAQMVDPVSFTSQLKTGSTADAEIVFSGVIDPGWHVYSTGLGDGGPIEAALKVNKLEGCELVGALQARGNEIAVFEELFGMDVR